MQVKNGAQTRQAVYENQLPLAEQCKDAGDGLAGVFLRETIGA
jgi:hypothetical protein